MGDEGYGLFRTGTARGQTGMFNPKFKKAFKKVATKKLKLPAKTAKAVRALVKAEIDKNNEDKFFQKDVIYQTTATDAVTVPAAAINLSMSGMVQGTDSGQRIGDNVRVKRATLRLAAIQNGGATVIGPQWLSIYVARARSTPITVPTLGQYQVLKQSFSTAGAFSQEQSDQPNSFYTFLNYNQWEVAWHENVLIGLAQPSVATGLSTNNDAVIYKEFNVDLTSKFGGVTKFQTNTPQNNTWFLFAYAYEINSAPTVGAVYPLIRGCLNFIYEDA